MKKEGCVINIGINTTSAVAGGGVTYLDNLIEYLSLNDKLNNYYIYTTNNPAIRQFESKYKNFKWSKYRFPSIAPILRMIWEQVVLPLYLKKHKIHVLFCPANIGPIFSSSHLVVVVQNMAIFNDDFIRYEKMYQKLRLHLLRILTIFTIKKADKIIFISRNAQEKICAEYNINYAKTALVYHGIDKQFDLSLNSFASNPLSDKHLPEKYILYVSNIYQYKNFYELILAFSAIKDEIDNDIQLIFAGICFDDLYYVRLRELIIKNSCEDRIRFIGHVPNDRLHNFYAKARLFVYPSTIENCPNILIEAMGCGAPIISSNIEPMPEICQDAALYFNPHDPSDIAKKMLKVLRSDDLRTNLSQKALRRAKFFSWEKTAKETLKVIEEVIS